MKSASKAARKTARKPSLKMTSSSSSRSSTSKTKPIRKRPAPVFNKTILSNGIKVITEAHPISRAVSCGIWVDKGTRHEDPRMEAGLAHFVEHMVFKRTKNRSAYQISRDMEAVGGELNAYTSRENTAFVSMSLSEHVDLSLDVLSDLVARPSFDPTDIKKEKQVVIQEIHMSEDQLEDIIFDKYFEKFYPDSTLGKPILGTVKSIEDMKRSTLLNFHKRQYIPENMMVAVAGDIEHSQVVDLVEKHLASEYDSGKPRAYESTKAAAKGSSRSARGRSSAGKSARASGPSEAAKRELDKIVGRVRPEAAAFREVIKRPSEQVHILIGHPTIDFRDQHRIEAIVVNTLLGGGMTSRLYQTVREEKGLVYTVFSQLTTHSDSGLNLIYAGTEPKHAPTVVELILKELRKLKKDGITQADLDLFKTQVKGSILLSADDVDNRMNSLAINEMMFGRYRSGDEVIADVERVSLDSVHEYIEMKFPIDKLGMLLMGALPEGPTKKWLDTL